MCFLLRFIYVIIHFIYVKRKWCMYILCIRTHTYKTTPPFLGVLYFLFFWCFSFVFFLKKKKKRHTHLFALYLFIYSHCAFIFYYICHTHTHFFCAYVCTHLHCTIYFANLPRLLKLVIDFAKECMSFNVFRNTRNKKKMSASEDPDVTLLKFDSESPAPSGPAETTTSGSSRLDRTDRDDGSRLSRAASGSRSEDRTIPSTTRETNDNGDGNTHLAVPHILTMTSYL